jgi:hypothetical protein
VYFFGYSKDVKGYRLLQPHSNEIIIEEMLNLMKISWLVSLIRCFFLLQNLAIFVPILVSSSSDDDSEDENPPPPAHLPLDESIEHEPEPTPPLPRWVRSTREELVILL